MSIATTIFVLMAAWSANGSGHLYATAPFNPWPVNSYEGCMENARETLQHPQVGMLEISCGPLK